MYRPVSDRKARIMLLNFSNFFAIFLGIHWLRSPKNGFERENFVLSFSAYPKPIQFEIK